MINTDIHNQFFLTYFCFKYFLYSGGSSKDSGIPLTLQ